MGEFGNQPAASGPAPQQTGGGDSAGQGGGSSAHPGTGTGTEPAPTESRGGGGSQADQSGPGERPTASWEERVPDWNNPGEELDVETTWSSPEEGRTRIDSTYHDAETGEWQGGSGMEGPSQPSDFAESTYRNRDGTTTEVRRNADGFTQSTTTHPDGHVTSIDTVKPDGSGHTDTFDAQGNRTSSKDYGPGER